jgi:hypothetical protein
MKTNLFSKSLFILCALMFASFSFAHATTINSTYVGPVGGNWSDHTNWNPAIVPNNSGSQMFNVSIGSPFPGVTLDLDVAISSLKITDPNGGIFSAGHSLSSTSTDIGTMLSHDDAGILFLSAQATSVTANLGNLADFSGTTLNEGYFVADTSSAAPGATAKIQFNGADIRTLNAYVGLYGPNASYVDQFGRNALAHFSHILFPGFLDLEAGTNFTDPVSLVNEGFVYLQNSGVFTVNGNYTGIGFPEDEGTLGIVQQLTPDPTFDSVMLIKGALTNYDAAHKTLNKTWFNWISANGLSAVCQVLGGSKPLDIVTSDASLFLVGPNTGFRDASGNDALRNLAVSAEFTIGDRDFTTVSAFTSTNDLNTFGNSHLTVNGRLTIKSGQLAVFALTGYALVGFPTDTPYKASQVIVRGNLTFMAGIEFLYGVYDTATAPSVTISGAAALAGDLVPLLFDVTALNSSNSFTALTARKITGQFSNVINGGRVSAFSFWDGTELGTFRVTITTTSVVLSDFQPSN